MFGQRAGAISSASTRVTSRTRTPDSGPGPAGRGAGGPSPTRTTSKRGRRPTAGARLWASSAASSSAAMRARDGEAAVQIEPAVVARPVGILVQPANRGRRGFIQGRVAPELLIAAHGGGDVDAQPLPAAVIAAATRKGNGKCGSCPRNSTSAGIDIPVSCHSRWSTSLPTPAPPSISHQPAAGANALATCHKPGPAVCGRFVTSTCPVELCSGQVGYCIPKPAHGHGAMHALTTTTRTNRSMEAMTWRLSEARRIQAMTPGYTRDVTNLTLDQVVRDTGSPRRRAGPLPPWWWVRGLRSPTGPMPHSFRRSCQPDLTAAQTAGTRLMQAAHQLTSGDGGS